jgi:hypothetical protein
MEERQGAVRLQTGYREGGKTGKLGSCRQDTEREERQGAIQYSCRQDTEREERQGAIQLQTGYRHGGKAGSYTAADRIQRGRKDKKLCSCRQDTIREERQGAMQLQRDTS